MGFQPPVPVEKALQQVNNRNYVLPAIQREFVWGTEQVRKLFDSLLRGYPIGSFLLWKVEPERAVEFTFYDFLQDYHEKDNPFADPHSVPAGQGVFAVLDGQQRFTSLNIGLYGSHAERQPGRRVNNPNAYPRKRLYIDLLGEGPEEELGMKYDFRFLTEDQAAPEDGAPDRWYKVGDVLHLSDSGPAIMHELERRELEGAEAFQTLYDLYKAIREAPSLNYYLEESQDPDKVLDIFVRVNSGGTQLSYSDLLLSMATNQWQERDAREEVRTLLQDLNNGSVLFNFSKDIVLKAGLTLIDAPNIGFKVSNFTRKNTSLMEKRWMEIRTALLVAKDLLATFGFSERTLTADSVVIPIAYHAFARGLGSNYVESSRDAADRDRLRFWAVRSQVKRGVWGSGLDTLLTRLREVIGESGGGQFPAEKLAGAMSALGKSLRFDDEEIEEICDLRYGRARTFPVLALLYPGLDLTKSFHEDHIFPRSLFTRRKLAKAGIPPEQVDQYMDAVDRVGNLQLLAGLPNVEKQATLPEAWLQGPHFTSDEMRENYLRENDLEDLPLRLDHFLEFYEGRRERIRERLRRVLDAQQRKDQSREE